MCAHMASKHHMFCLPSPCSFADEGFRFVGIGRADPAFQPVMPRVPKPTLL
jgi:hypothetical protein